MNFEQLKRRVERAEFLVDARTRQTHASWDALRLHWRQAWTPSRIIIAGLVTGFLSGRAKPAAATRQLRAVAGPKTLELVSSITGVVASLQAAYAAMTAKGAARTADQAAETAGQAADVADDAAVTAAAAAPVAAAAMDADADAVAATLSPSQRRRRPDPALHGDPRPAEAATDVSEQR
jgi:hypothetical protein